jgi:hypothetical protein
MTDLEYLTKTIKKLESDLDATTEKFKMEVSKMSQEQIKEKMKDEVFAETYNEVFNNGN